MKNKIYILFYLIFLGSLFSCLNHTKKESDISLFVDNLIGKEVKIPKGIYFTRYIKDTINYDLKKEEYKILFYMDSIGCLECKLKLNRWKSLMSELELLPNISISYLFFFDTKYVNKIEDILYENDFDYPVCIDINSEFRKNNFISENSRFQTFLLDKNNIIVAVGNPVMYEGIKTLYKKIITHK